MTILMNDDYQHLAALSRWDDQLYKICINHREAQNRDNDRREMKRWIKYGIHKIQGTTKTCVICFNDFEVKDKAGTQKFCSAKCRSRNYVSIRSAKDKAANRKHRKVKHDGPTVVPNG